MKESIILISAVCGDIGSAAVRALKETGIRIIGYDMKLYSPVSDIVDRFYQSPPAYHEESYIEFLKEIINKEGVNFLLPVSEPEIEVMNTRREDIERLGVKLLLNNRTILDNTLDKLKTALYLEKLGIKVPKSVLLKDYDGSLGYPLIVKARRGHGSKRIWNIEGEIDLEYIRHKDDGSLIVQEYIGNDDEDYTTGVFSNGNLISSITFKRKLGYGGLSIEVILAEEPFLENLARHIGTEMKLIGSINIQSRRSGEIFIPYEINPRLSSTLPFRKEFGFDDVVWWVNVLIGKGYSYNKRYKSGRAIRCFSEYYFDMKEI